MERRKEEKGGEAGRRGEEGEAEAGSERRTKEGTLSESEKG